MHIFEAAKRRLRRAHARAREGHLMGGKGSGGQNKQPVERHKQRGSYRKGRHGKDPAAGEQGAPRCPKHFVAKGYAAEQWKRLISLLTGMGVLTLQDYTALEIHCRTYEEWRECCDYVDENGYVHEIVTEEHGTHRKEHPESVRAKQLLPILAQQLAKFGLTPADRTGMSSPPQKGDDAKSKERFFRNG